MIKFLLMSISLFSFLCADEFDMKDPKNVNNIIFMLDSPLEPINGVGSDISGKVQFDPQNNKSLTGKIVLKTNSVTVPNADMTKYMHGEMWLNAEKNPEIVVEFKEVLSAESKGEGHELKVKANMTLNGNTKEIEIGVHVTHLPGKLEERMKPGIKGDLVALRSTFTIKRSEFGIMPGKFLSKVADEIEITARLIGSKMEN